MNRISELVKQYRLANQQERTCRYCKYVFSTITEKREHVAQVHRAGRPVKKGVRKYDSRNYPL